MSPHRTQECSSNIPASNISDHRNAWRLGNLNGKRVKTPFSLLMEVELSVSLINIEVQGMITGWTVRAMQLCNSERSKSICTVSCFLRHTCKEHSFFLQWVFIGSVYLGRQVWPVGGHQHRAAGLASEVDWPEQEPGRERMSGWALVR